MSDAREPWRAPDRRLPPDVQRGVNERGLATVWRELEAHGIGHPVHKPTCTCHRCQLDRADHDPDDDRRTP